MITYYFHVRRFCRIKYNFEESLFSITGDLIVANFYQARLLAQNINQTRTEEGKTDSLVSPGMINGFGLLHEIFHFIIRHYELNLNPGVFSRCIDHLKKNIGKDQLDLLLLEFIRDFPSPDIINNKITPEEYLNDSTDGKENRELLIEELLLLNLENENPAAVLLEELFSDKELALKTGYLKFINETERFFVTEKPIGADNLPLTHFLKLPLKNNPLTIEAQLDYIREKWGVFIYQVFNERLLTGKDLIQEDYKFLTRNLWIGKPSPPVPAYEFDREYFDMLRKKMESGINLSEAELQYYQSETERFTEDIDWMPRVVMIAKNAFVWLYQLSAKYGREIRSLDQIPDEELDILARWNFTALWLIGIWERSPASKKIKQYMGNPDAAASAYSLYDYVVANELGGEEAFEVLKARAWKRGIRMASDMVPNHTGIFSKWVIEKPDYFIQSDHPPYPSYSFHSSDLSDDDRVEVRIEDKYYNHSDAAVVFQRRDSHTGSVKYIYHGNDGTHMPWNDTAQLNLLNPEVRESLIQTIMHVARKTPIIRFDAAMTLTKKHFQRLWFPIPGTGSGIPSRSDYAMTRSQFDDVMQNEFWREVVDRINNELPNTLLLAEAFWLMESYFVRTLGMHRVYNSAFMHMFMKEENEKYRLLIKNTLNFNPEILKRYVNFMSNPDEETAVNQFGKGDKYFGVAVVMVTLPGLPMFGHGQIEGLAEKYGMEYKRAYYDEHVDEYLVQRHQKEIFPLMAKRYLFSQVNDFEFYDFIDDQGSIVENVYAYSNRSGNERALIIYNNSYTETRGSIRLPVQKQASTSEIRLHNNLGDALGINPEWKVYYIYKDHRSHLEYLISGFDLMENGIHVYLAGYQYYALLDFREVYDHQGDYERLRLYLSGRGVPSIQYAMEELKLTPFHTTIKHLMSADILDDLKLYTSRESSELSERTESVLRSILESINHYDNIHFDNNRALSGIKEKIRSLKDAKHYLRTQEEKLKKPSWINEALKLKLNSDLIFPFIVLYQLRIDSGVKDIFMKVRFDIPLYDSIEEKRLSNEIPLLNIFISDLNLTKKSQEEFELVKSILKDPNTSSYLKLNTWEGVTYYSKENFEELLYWYGTVTLLMKTEETDSKLKKRKNAGSRPPAGDKVIKDTLTTNSGVILKILNASDEAEYKRDDLIKILKTSSNKPQKKEITERKEKTADTIKKNAVKQKTTGKETGILNKQIPIKKKTVKEVIKKKKGKNDEM